MQYLYMLEIFAHKYLHLALFSINCVNCLHWRLVSCARNALLIHLMKVQPFISFCAAFLLLLIYVFSLLSLSPTPLSIQTTQHRPIRTSINVGMYLSFQCIFVNKPFHCNSILEVTKKNFCLLIHIFERNIGNCFRAVFSPPVYVYYELDSTVRLFMCDSIFIFSPITDASYQGIHMKMAMNTLYIIITGIWRGRWWYELKMLL